jgi:large subunit ribosomal protein L15
MPLQRRLPKVGFARASKVVYQVVNLDDLARRGLTGDVTPETLAEARLIRSAKHPVKVLGRGEVQQALKVRVHAVSSSASEKIVQAGGSIELVSGKAPVAE